MADKGKRNPGARRECALRVLLVCSGNTCRSPMAEGILRHLLPEDLEGALEIRSAGVRAVSGMPASPGALKAAGARGVSLDSFRSHRLTRQMAAEADLILAMDRGHRQAVLALDPAADEKTYLLHAFAARLPRDEGRVVPDPLGGDTRLYRKVFNELKVALQESLPRLAALARETASRAPEETKPGTRPKHAAANRKRRS